MTPDSPIDPRQALEASLTALLLGELPSDQAAFLRQTIARDPDLARTYARLERTINLVRETEVEPVPATTPHRAPLKLSEQRREQLLQRFKTVPLPQPARREFSWLVPVAVAAVLMVILGAALLPALSKAKSRSMAMNLSMHAPAKQPQNAGTWSLGRHGVETLPETKEEPIAGVRLRQLTLPAAPAPVAAAPPQTIIVLPSLNGQAAQPVAPEGDLAGKPIASLSGLGGGGGGGIGGSPQTTPPASLSSVPANSGPQLAPEAEAAFARRSFYRLTAPPSGNTQAGDLAVPSLPAESSLAAAAPGSSAVNPVTGLPIVAGAIAPTEPTAGLPMTVTPVDPTTRLPLASAAPLPDAGASYFEAAKVAKDRNAPVGAQAPQQAPVLGAAPVVGGLFREAQVTSDQKLRDQLTLDTQPSGDKEGVRVSTNFYTQPQATPDSPAMILSAETAQRLATLRDESQIELNRQKALLDRARKTDSTDLAKTLPQLGIKDAALQGLVEKEMVAEQNLATLKQQANPDASQFAKTFAQANDLKKQINERVAGINRGALEFKIASLEQSVTNLGQELNRIAPASTPANGEPDTGTKSKIPPPQPQPEIQTSDNPFSTFSLNVSDVSFKLAAASLQKGVLPDPASIRSEEFINAFDYRDPVPPAGVPVGFTWERAQYPFAQNRDLLRFSLKTAAQGREAGRPLNVVLLLDNSGSMERADRVRIIHEALRVLAAQLQPQDTFSVVTFARTAHLWVDGVPGNQAGAIVEQVSSLTPQGGTNLGEALRLAYQTALRHYLATGMNRVVLLTDGAANLGDVDPSALQQTVETNRKQGIALDCFGIGWEDYNDDLLEVLTRHGDGRYGFLNTPEEAATGFANQLAGALKIAAADVKVQVEFNPQRVTAYRQLGYARHQLTKEQFRDNTVDAAELGAAESGTALYVVEVNGGGDGPLAKVRIRYKVPGTAEFHEYEWAVPYTGNAVPLVQASPALRLAACAAGFAEWLAGSPYAAELSPDVLLPYLAGVPEVYGADMRPKNLEWMLRQAKSLSGK
ncbi:MAG TPA: von Willebrand factor type A domain-containing protein [Verrucomicrobiae bacterium]|nr:von Willebrand factor type A domain-containing protein [Verrucomicrobiae bacterium]